MSAHQLLYGLLAALGARRPRAEAAAANGASPPGSSSVPSCSRSAGRPGPRRRPRSTRTTSPPSSTTACRSPSTGSTRPPAAPVRLHRPEDRRPQRHLVDGVLEPQRAPRLEPRWHSAGPRARPHARPDRDGRPAGRRSGLQLRRHRQRPLDRRARRLREQRLAAPRADREAAPARESLAGVFNDGWIGSKGPAGSVSADYNLFDRAGQARRRCS